MRFKVLSRSTTFLAASMLAALGAAHAADTAGESNGRDVLSVAKQKGNFNTLARAIEAAGLTQTLTAQGPITVFAPTDEAFAKLPPEQLEALLKPENRDQLVKILTYHVVPGKALDADDLKKRRETTTAAGEELPIALVRGRLRVGDARVTGEIDADNGVVHAIDRVLIPN